MAVHRGYNVKLKLIGANEERVVVHGRKKLISIFP
jgi:hypothetical protein